MPSGWKAWNYTAFVQGQIVGQLTVGVILCQSGTGLVHLYLLDDLTGIACCQDTAWNIMCHDRSGTDCGIVAY